MHACRATHGHNWGLQARHFALEIFRGILETLLRQATAPTAGLLARFQRIIDLSYGREKGFSTCDLSWDTSDARARSPRHRTTVQGYLIDTKQPAPPPDHHRTLGIGLL